MHIHSRVGSAKPAPHRMARGAASVVVQSIGYSGVGLVRSLRRVVPLPEPDIAALLFQAPSVLLTGLDRSTAELMAGSLRETGLDCAVLDGDADIEEGIGDHEVALHLNECTRMPAVTREVMCVLGIDERNARQLVCAMPAVFLTDVSAATVNALRARFTPLGAGIDASRHDTARFDLFLGHCTPALRERALARVQSVAGVGGGLDDTWGLLGNVDRQTLDVVRQELRQLAVPLYVVNRDFAGYALILQQGEDTPQLRHCLAELAGVQDAAIPHLLRNLPVVLQHGLRQGETAAALAALLAVGARASAEPVAFQRFSLTLNHVPEPTPLLPVLCELAELKEADARDILRTPVPRLPGPFTATQARWLAHELRRAGGSVQVESLV